MTGVTRDTRTTAATNSMIKEKVALGARKPNIAIVKKSDNPPANSTPFQKLEQLNRTFRKKGYELANIPESRQERPQYYADCTEADERQLDTQLFETKSKLAERNLVDD